MCSTYHLSLVVVVVVGEDDDDNDMMHGARVSTIHSSRMLITRIEPFRIWNNAR